MTSEYWWKDSAQGNLSIINIWQSLFLILPIQLMARFWLAFFISNNTIPIRSLFLNKQGITGVIIPPLGFCDGPAEASRQSFLE